MERPTVDVVIPTYKPGKIFEELLRRLSRQTYPVTKIVIMNTEEQYWQRRWEQEYPILQVHHLDTAASDHGGTRAEAASLRNSEYMICMTQDAMPADSRLVENLLKPLISGEAQASYARQLPAKDCHLIERLTREFNYPEKSVVKSSLDLEQMGIKTYFLSNVCAAYNKATYEALGGFTEQAIFNEDMYYAAELIDSGYRIAYQAEAKVIHSHNYTCMQQFHRNFDMGVSQACRPEIFQNIPSEGEGIALVRKTASSLIKRKKSWMIALLVIQSASKYLGYLMGKEYRKLPRAVIRFCTMNPAYWERQWNPKN